MKVKNENQKRVICEMRWRKEREFPLLNLGVESFGSMLTHVDTQYYIIRIYITDQLNTHTHTADELRDETQRRQEELRYFVGIPVYSTWHHCHCALQLLAFTRQWTWKQHCQNHWNVWLMDNSTRWHHQLKYDIPSVSACVCHWSMPQGALHVWSCDEALACQLHRGQQLHNTHTQIQKFAQFERFPLSYYHSEDITRVETQQTRSQAGAADPQVTADTSEKGLK